ncbi:FAD binding domain-containing protein [Truncatella angustata]|uniref:FAD binding domain-containing protein n=1 Tax=Truncatella angustata TaxID=152316 RepID=A0A9P8UI47_9PEZI|nr:FAD binding domain-containing protein [Truncatella angustata]KAH6652617.1 FAD binding domain-containing protein [Truncatella angustata]
MPAQTQLSVGSHRNFDIIVVGAGNAGYSAAISAAESLGPNSGHRVLLIDKCPEEWAGGNSYFTAGAMRTVHGGLKDVLPIINNVDDKLVEEIDLDPYTREDFLHDMHRVTDGRFDRALGEALVDESNATIKWLAGHGMRYQLSFNRQSYKVNGRYKFWGGMCLKTEDGGKGLVQDHQAACKRLGVVVLHSTAAKKINLDPQTGAFSSLIVESKNCGCFEIRASAVILAAGGFEANPRMRAQYLGHGWDLAHVRGTPYNTGEVLEIAMRDISARQAGHWSGCHATAWDANSPQNTGDRIISNEFTKSGYPLGITLNTQGERFFDEGSDLRNYTYAKFGKAILGQPGGTAFQVWDSEGILWLRSEEYRDEIVDKIHGASIEELATNCAKAGLENPSRFAEEVKEYNEAVQLFQQENNGKKWDPAVRDGLSTQSSQKKLKIPKSNWALPLTKGPYMAVRVRCGVTFTFGGLAVDPKTSGVISNLTGKTVPGVFCCGEMLGGLFYQNYPGGSGLTSGAIFGRKAGKSAADIVHALSSSRRSQETALARL